MKQKVCLKLGESEDELQTMKIKKEEKKREERTRGRVARYIWESGSWRVRPGLASNQQWAS